MKIDESKSSVNFFECVPQEILHRILSFLTFEQLDGIRSVNRRFCAAGNYMLKKEFVRLQQEVHECLEKTRIKMLNSQKVRLAKGKRNLYKMRDYASQIYWFAVDQLMSNSFCYFDIRTGYLPQEYSVSGKTLDVVHFLLWFKDTKDPVLHFLETQIGRSPRDCNMMSYTEHITAFDSWYMAKKHDYTDRFRNPIAEFVYRPVYSRKHPKLNLPKGPWHLGRFIYTMTVDLFSELFTQNQFNEKKHLVHFSRPHWACCQDAEAIQAVKPNQTEDEENHTDESDFEPEMEIERFRTKIKSIAIVPF